MQALTINAIGNLPEISIDMLGPASPIARVDFLGEFPDTIPIAHTPHLSPSHLRDRSYCAAQNWYQRSHHLKRPIGATMIRGSAIHSGLNLAMYHNRTTLQRGHEHPIGFDEFEYIAQRTAYRATLREIARARDGAGVAWDRRWQKGPTLDAKTLIYDVYRAVKTAAPTYYDRYPLAVEAAFLLHWTSPQVYPLMAVADLIELRPDGTLGVRDTKSSIKKKSLNELALDRGLMAYGASATDHFGATISAIAYDNITFTSPGRKKDALPKPTITLHEFILPYEERTIEALQIESADAMLDIHDTRISPRRTNTTCPGCAFKTECGRDFGPLHSYLTAPLTDEDESDG